MRKKIVIGTRSSKLALWQAEYVADRLRKQYEGLEVELMHIVTKGDKILDVPLAKIGGKGLFTKELEVAMLEKRVDLAVHSLKDMPTVLPTGLSLTTITKRLDCGDALVSPKYKTLENLPQGAKVGTSSLRRKAQLLKARPDLDIHSLRGNVNTRLRKLEEENFDEDDEEIKQMLEFLHDDKTADATKAERSFLARVEGGCQVPVGVYAQVEDDDNLSVEAVIGSIDGKCIIRDKIIGSRANAKTLGKDLAEKLLANGGLKIMQSLGLCCPDENAQ